jgi:Telomere length regulation protein
MYFADENASDLAIALFTLQDNFELEGFETMRIKALISLIVSCPRKAAPYVPVHSEQR